MSNDRIVWMDCEMTGLDLVSDALVEVACVVTDSELNPIDEGIDVVIAPPPEALAHMDQVVVDMHTESGLLPLLPGGLALQDAQEILLAYLRGHLAEPRKAPLAGSSVHVDRAFLGRDMPEVLDLLHYRIIDVSSIKELVRRWYPRTFYNSPAKRGGHRALADTLDSIHELRYYRATVFVPEPGPTSEEAKAATAALEVDR